MQAKKKPYKIWRFSFDLEIDELQTVVDLKTTIKRHGTEETSLDAFARPLEYSEISF